MQAKTYRRDIDGLRAVAVICVIVYHAFPSLLPSGFVGVDVFFVISGYLISSIIARNLDDRSFSIGEFYASRVRRIFPALVLVLVCVYAAGWQLLFPEEFKQLGKQIAAGTAFASNFALLKDVGYFDASVDTKPLLHLWSLGIEEQFYIAWPLLLVGAYRMRMRLWILASLIAAASLAVDLRLGIDDAAGAFYSPQGRAWELAAGAILATAASGSRWRSDRLRDTVSVVGAVAVVVAAICLGGGKAYPGWWALIPTLGAVLLIAAGPNGVVSRVALSSRPLVFIGLLSYPLYLWHWPLLVFCRIGVSGTLSAPVRFGLLVTSLIAAWVTYRFVEIPIRTSGGIAGRIKLASLCLLMATVALAGVNAYTHNGLSFRSIVRANRSIFESVQWDYWTSPTCVAKYDVEPCVVSGSRPETMLLGDSHANHLYPGLVRTDKKTHVINVGTCWPLVDVIMGIAKNQEKWPCSHRDTFLFDRQLLDAEPSVKTVIIAGWWSPVLEGYMPTQEFEDKWGSYSLKSKRSKEAGLDRPELLFLGLSRAITHLESKNINVILVLDTPFIYEDLKEYCALGSRFGIRSDCSMPRALFETSRTKEVAVIGRLKAAHRKLAVFDPLPLFCNANKCYFVRNGTVLFRDQNHLSVAGSELIGSHLAPLISSLVENKPIN